MTPKVVLTAILTALYTSNFWLHWYCLTYSVTPSWASPAGMLALFLLGCVLPTLSLILFLGVHFGLLIIGWAINNWNK